MASFNEHIRQANSNLLFLSLTNSANQTFWDWQITISFYVAVHLANAHIAKIANLHYRTHEDVKDAISPFSQLSLCKVPQDIHLSYTKLEGLSRRARYLCSDDLSVRSNTANLTNSKHFARSIRHLDKIIEYFKGLHEFECPKCKINCPEFSKSEDIKNFEI